MIGHSEIESSITDVLWPDAMLELVSADYHSVALRVRESTGRIRTVRCNGYIGYKLLGFWDEAVIRSAELIESSSFIEQCVNDISGRLGEVWLDSGDRERNTRHWRALIVHLSDGASVQVAASQFSAD